MKGLRREELLETSSTPGWATAIEMLDNLVQSAETDVISHDLNNPNVTELVIKKARAEGARRLVARFKTQLASLKPQNG